MNTMKHDHVPATVRPYGRLKLVGAGLVLAVVGSTRLLRGVQAVTHWTGQPMFSWGLIAAGGLCILLALIPLSWIGKQLLHARRRIGNCQPCFVEYPSTQGQ